MTRPLTFLLLSLNLVLAAVLAWLWLSPAGQRSTHWTAPAPVVPQLGAGSAGTLPGQQADAAGMAAVLERPVFALTRRPVPPAKAAAAAPVAPPSDPMDSVHVFGLFSGSEGGGVIVRADGKTRRLKVSDSLGEWRLKEIRGTDAVFARNGQTRVLSLVQVKQGAASAPTGRPGLPAPVPAPAPVWQAVPAPPPTPSAPPPQTPPAPGQARTPGAASSPFVIGGAR